MNSAISLDGSGLCTSSRSLALSFSALVGVATGGKGSFGFSMNCNFYGND